MATQGFRPPINVVLAHPSEATRRALGDEVAGTDITIIGEADDGPAALAMVLDLVPDVALIAVDLTEIDGAAVGRALRDELPACRVLLLAEHDDAQVGADLASGALGCYLTGEPPMSLIRAIRGTMRREALPTAAWAETVLAQYRELTDDESARTVPAPHLTVTEAEVLQQIAAGKTPDEVAELHNATTHLVRLHAGYAITKLNRAIADEILVQTVP